MAMQWQKLLAFNGQKLMKANETTKEIKQTATG